MVWLLSHFFIHDLPDEKDISQRLAREPLQTKVDVPPFKVHTEETTYTVTPKYSYEIQGLVVSVHHSGSVFDIVHELWGDQLNIKDICLLWGTNVRNQLYDHFSFSSGDFTCFYQTDDYEAWQAFNESQISNNHILAVDPEVVDHIMEADVGDQIYMKGYLSIYTHAGGFLRSTSTTRQDRGDGACETIFVNSFEMLHRANDSWHSISTFSGWATLALGMVLLIMGLKSFFFTPRITAEEYFERAKDAVLAGRFPRAVRELTFALDANPSYAKAYEMRAALYERLGRLGDAHADMEVYRHLKKEREATPDNVADFL